MTENRQKLLDRMIKIYGYEHSIVINFAKKLESFENCEENDMMLKSFVEYHEKKPCTEDDE